MKLLLDANISWRLIKVLEFHFVEVNHVERIIEAMAKDKDIWKFAKENDYIIITNDEDFVNLLNLNGFPPKVVLLKTGNQSNTYIANLLIEKKNEIERMANDKIYGLLELY